MVVNVGVILSGPIQFAMDNAAELLKAKAKLAVFAAASALRARQSAELVHTRSRQIMRRDLSRQLSSVDEDHIRKLTSNITSRQLSSLQTSNSQDTLPASSSSVTTVLAAQILQPDHDGDTYIVPGHKHDHPHLPLPGNLAQDTRPMLQDQRFDEEHKTDYKHQLNALREEKQLPRQQLEIMHGSLECSAEVGGVKVAFI